MVEETKKPKKTVGQKTSECCRSCCKFMWNSEERTCMGRTGWSWVQILSFYLCFYAVIAGIWAVCMAVFLATLDPYAPTQLGMYSMLKNNPGMGQWPAPQLSGSTLVNFDSSNSSTYQTFINTLNQAVSIYNSSYPNILYPNCSIPSGVTANISVGCYFNPALLGVPCSNASSFGYNIGKPCVLLRINKIYGWSPQPLFNGGNTTNENTFRNIPSNFKTSYNGSPNNTYIPISCTGLNDGDADNINSVTFYPPYGIDASFFPYYNQPNYQPPAVMAQFDLVPGVGVMVWCKFWTQNVIFDVTDLQGSVHLELQVSNYINQTIPTSYPTSSAPTMSATMQANSASTSIGYNTTVLASTQYPTASTS
jgi:sodium/potassium-transporting ATPase subunit beta